MILGATLAVLAAAAVARWGWRYHRALIAQARQARDAERRAHAAEVRLARRTRRRVCRRRLKPGPALRHCTNHYAAPCGPGGCDD